MDLLAALGDWPGAVLLRRSTTVYLLVNATHILAIGLLVGAIVTLDLRLLGFFRAHPLAHLAPPLRRVAGSGLVLAIATGFLLFTTRPPAYLENPAFLAKLGLLAFGLLNIAVVHRRQHWRHAVEGGIVHGQLRVAALVSLLVWVGAVIAGRWIGFLQ